MCCALGSSAELHFPSTLGKHQLALGYNCRRLYGFALNVPMVTREEAGYSVKSSIKVGREGGRGKEEGRGKERGEERERERADSSSA